MQAESKQRNEFIDFIKAIAIISVMVGHSIQYGSGAYYRGNGSFFYNRLFIFIYSFHMPLFMIVSGYLFAFSVKKHSLEYNIKTRITSLLVPIAVWTLPKYLLYIFSNYGNITLFQAVKQYFFLMKDNLWFLWAIMFASVIVLAVREFFKDSAIMYLLIFAATFFIPDTVITQYSKFMFPFFVIGYLFNKNMTDGVKNFLAKPKNRLAIFVIFALIYLKLFTYYNIDSYIYLSGYYILKEPYYLSQFTIDMYRFAIGLVGCICAVVALKAIWDILPGFILRIASFIGRHSLGIYIISDYIFTWVLVKITYDNATINYSLLCAETVIITAVSLAATVLISKIPILNKLLLGGR